MATMLHERPEYIKTIILTKVLQNIFCYLLEVVCRLVAAASRINIVVRR